MRCKVDKIKIFSEERGDEIGDMRATLILMAFTYKS
jgi:hypothetical protein